MKNIRITTTLIVVFFFALNLFSQEQFERLYRSNNWQNLGLDVVQTSDMGYLILSAGKHPDSLLYEHVNITKLEPKGDIQWSKNYDFEKVLLRQGELALLENDSFVFTMILSGAEMNKSITKADPAGNVVWSKTVGQQIPANPVIGAATGNILPTEDLGLALFDNAHTSAGQQNLFMSRLDTAGNLLWSRTWESTAGAAPLDQRTLDAKNALTNDFIVGGITIENFMIGGLLVNVDSLGAINWGKRYNVLVGNAAATEIRAVESTVDSGYVIGGIYRNTSALATGWVMKTDSIGNVIWSYLINDPTLTVIPNIFIQNVIPEDDGSTVVLGLQVEPPFSFATKNFALKLSPAGTIEWQYYYYENAQNPSVNNLIMYNQVKTNDDGYAAFGYTLENINGDNVPIPYILKIDENGESSCQDTSTFQAFSIPVNVDSLAFTSQDLDFIDSLEIEHENFNFDIPILSLDAPTFCEGEPIMHTFDATVPGAVSYEWNTGDTTATLTVTQEGMYIVEVRVEEDICYTMCDTTMITVIGPPTAEITPNFSSFCMTGQGILVAEGGSNYVWSTGETGQLITIDQTGTYSVTVTNQCDSAFASVNITEFPTAPDIEIGILTDSFCTAGFRELIILGNTGGAIEWSTGETTSTIQVSEAGTISAIVDFGDCGTSSDEVILSACISEFDCVKIPNAFTPDGDSMNDTFWPVIPPECNDIQVIEMKIFSRWGELVFETRDPNLQWDGNYKGDPAASDVYAFMIRLVNGNEDSKVLSGDVTLLR